MDSIPLEWDHTGDVGGSSSHEDEEEGPFYSALSGKGGFPGPGTSTHLTVFLATIVTQQVLSDSESSLWLVQACDFLASVLPTFCLTRELACSCYRWDNIRILPLGLSADDSSQREAPRLIFLQHLSRVIRTLSVALLTTRASNPLRRRTGADWGEGGVLLFFKALLLKKMGSS